MDTLCSWPMVTIFLLCIGGLILMAIFSGKDDRPALRLIAKADLDKLLATTFPRGNNLPVGASFATMWVIGDCDYGSGPGLPGVNLDLRRYSWRELCAACSAEYATEFANVENKICLF
jgi:hypothetical protein